MTNYSSSDYKTSSTLFSTKSSLSQAVNPLLGVNIYSDKVTMAKHSESDRMNESKSMNNSNYDNDTNFSNVMSANATASNVKMEQMIKSEKAKSFSESDRSKSECIESGSNQRTDNSTSSINQMNLVGSHQSASCYSNAIDTSVEPTMNPDEMCYRGYSNPTDISRSSVPFANDMMANRALVANYEYSAVRSYENAMNGISSGPTFDRYDMNLGNLYASSLSMQRSNLTYSPYLNSFAADDPNQQKYLHDHHFSQAAMLKNESGGETAAPYYPKPMYHYDPSFPLAGFSAMNLSLRTAAAAAAAANGSLSIMDLPSSASSSNLHTTNSPHYSTVQRLQTNTTSTSTSKPTRSPNSSPQANNSEQQPDNRMPVSNHKLQSYQLHGENFTAQNSRSSPSEPVDLCNGQIKPPPHSGAFTSDTPMENVQNRPYSRESTSDSNASPYVDTYKGEPMGKFCLCYYSRQRERKIFAQQLQQKTFFKSISQQFSMFFLFCYLILLCVRFINGHIFPFQLFQLNESSEKLRTIRFTILIIYAVAKTPIYISRQKKSI